MIIMEIFRCQNGDPLWDLAVWCLLPLIMVEIVFLILAGTIMRTSTTKAGKGWIFGFVFFVLGIGLECGFARLLRLLFPYKDGILGNWLLGIVIALIAVGVISYGMYQLLQWIDCTLYDHYRKAEAFRQKAIGIYQRR